MNECSGFNPYVEIYRNAKTGASTDDGKIPLTVGKAFDAEIQRLREPLERVTIARARAETLGLLDYPVGDLRSVLGYVI